MTRTTFIFASLLAICTSPVFGQVVVTSRPVVTYYSPAAPVVTSRPVFASPVVPYAAPVTVSRPVTTFYAPTVTGAPVSTYYAPASYAMPTTSYYAPGYYAPVTTYYGGPVVTPAFGQRVWVRRPIYYWP
jgi:hypothetical protein